MIEREEILARAREEQTGGDSCHGCSSRGRLEVMVVSTAEAKEGLGLGEGPGMAARRKLLMWTEDLSHRFHLLACLLVPSCPSTPLSYTTRAGTQALVFRLRMCLYAVCPIRARRSKPLCRLLRFYPGLTIDDFVALIEDRCVAFVFGSSACRRAETAPCTSHTYTQAPSPFSKQAEES